MLLLSKTVVDHNAMCFLCWRKQNHATACQWVVGTADLPLPSVQVPQTISHELGYGHQDHLWLQCHAMVLPLWHHRASCHGHGLWLPSREDSLWRENRQLRWEVGPNGVRLIMDYQHWDVAWKLCLISIIRMDFELRICDDLHNSTDNLVNIFHPKSTQRRCNHGRKKLQRGSVKILNCV